MEQRTTVMMTEMKDIHKFSKCKVMSCGI